MVFYACMYGMYTSPYMTYMYIIHMTTDLVKIWT